MVDLRQIIVLCIRDVEILVDGEEYLKNRNKRRKLGEGVAGNLRKVHDTLTNLKTVLELAHKDAKKTEGRIDIAKNTL